MIYILLFNGTIRTHISECIIFCVLFINPSKKCITDAAYLYIYLFHWPCKLNFTCQFLSSLKLAENLIPVIAFER